MWASIASAAIALVTALINGIGSFFSWRRDQSLKEQGRLEQKNMNLEDQIQVIVKAEQAREKAVIAARSIPESDSLPDDGFRRD